jgi:hypothetical protein
VGHGTWLRGREGLGFVGLARVLRLRRPQLDGLVSIVLRSLLLGPISVNWVWKGDVRQLFDECGFRDYGGGDG